MLSVVFAVSYQSLHAFTHHSHEEINFFSSEKTFTKTISEKEECPVCEFKFVPFISPEVFHFEFIPSFYEIPYQFNSNETCITFEGNSFYLRGPPILV
jgi:hypothetical protein